MPNYNLDYFEAWDTLKEAENINKDSVFNVGIKYDNGENDLTTDLDMINVAILENEVPFIVLARLFDIYINNRNLIVDKNIDIAKQIWWKLKNIIDNKNDNTPELAGLAWYKKLQYYYNAYVSEEAIEMGIPGIEFGTSPEEHSILYCDKTAVDTPDFKNFKVANVPMTLEAKNYGGPATMNDFIEAKDRRQFHGADFILVYLMSQKRWVLAYNSPTTKYYNFDNLQLQKPHVNITMENNRINVSEWN